jgi:flagellar protein FliO/FliZ
MAKQLEEALKRPSPPPAPRPVVPHNDEVKPSEAEPQEPTGQAVNRPLGPAAPANDERGPDHGPDRGPERGPELDRIPAPPRPTMVEPSKPAPAPVPPAPAPAKDVSDPFSVEEIEAEFARLLGRPFDKAEKS